MPLSPNEAAETLKDISQVERRSATAYGNNAASPHLIMWGIIWILGYGGIYYLPGRPYIFPVLSLAGVVGSFVIAARGKKERSSGYSWRYLASIVALFAFITALFAVNPPTRDAQVAAFFPLLVSLAYMLMGIWARLIRIGVVGVAIGVLTVAGYFYLQDYYLLWLAVVGGGALVLGGLWMRSI